MITPRGMLYMAVFSSLPFLSVSDTFECCQCGRCVWCLVLVWECVDARIGLPPIIYCTIFFSFLHLLLFLVCCCSLMRCNVTCSPSLRWTPKLSKNCDLSANTFACWPTTWASWHFVWQFNMETKSLCYKLQYYRYVFLKWRYCTTQTMHNYCVQFYRGWKVSVCFSHTRTTTLDSKLQQKVTWHLQTCLSSTNIFFSVLVN